jgi:FixJ family two-component response regulator
MLADFCPLPMNLILDSPAEVYKRCRPNDGCPIEGATQVYGARRPDGKIAAQPIFVVDDDPAIRNLLRDIFCRAGYNVTCFADGLSLLAGVREGTPECIILDVHIPGRSGLDVLKELHAQEYATPIFVISGQGDIPTAVDAIKHGAIDFIEKPFRGTEVVERVRSAIAATSMRGVNDTPHLRSLHFPNREPLTMRERQVLKHIAAGESNKEVARSLGISPRTIELHRAHIMTKLAAKNIADLVRIVFSEGQAHAV